MKPLKVVVLLISALALTACGIKNRSSNNDLPSRSTPTEHSAISGAIGASGGVVKDEEENVTISIPQGALQEDTNISAQYIEEPSYLEANPSMNFLGAVEFGPSGTTFDKPVEVSLQLTDTPKNNKISIFCYSEEYDIWDYVTDASVNNNIATFNISHFSKYKALDISMEMLMKFNNLVRQAQATGQSDSWIHENFKNYLINEEHIMDIYSYFGGYWYEPCGLIIGGNYHINGKEGDPNELTELIGETNKVGNTYGLCHDGQLIVDSKTYKKIAGQPKEDQETISVNVGVYYKMIKPDIDLTASKKKLNKGENATINIRCHYTNAKNFYPEFKDLDLACYMLTIAKPTHFFTDRSAVVTDGSGRASFVVTALENDKAETITVNFDVSGNFGTHAEGNITLNSAGISISGHIKEEIDMVWRVPVEILAKGSWSVTENGTFNLVVEYDFEGTLVQEEDKPMTGELQFTNASASFASTPCAIRGTIEDGQGLGIGTYDYFSGVSGSTPHLPTYNVVGSISDDLCSLYSDDDASEIVTVSGSGNINIYAAAGGVVDYETDVDDAYSLIIRNSDLLLLNFALNPGTETYTSMTFKDKLGVWFSAEGYSMEFDNFADMNIIPVSETRKTTQTITVS